MVASRLARFASTIFSEISAMAQEYDAVDLGQGYPNYEGPDFAKSAAVAAVTGKSNQYPPAKGIPELRLAIARRWELDTDMEVDPETEVTVTSGCTEALAAAFLGLVEPGDEVVLFEPAYDAYPVGCSLAGATVRYVTLRPPDFGVTEEALTQVFSPKTRAIVVNTPHNPTGRVLALGEMNLIARFAQEFDSLVFTDEVYERILYDGNHISMATLPGMWERTVTMSSIGKSFSLTGWKTGWAIAPRELTAGVRAAHNFLTFTTPNPMQHGAAAALAADDGYYTALAASYRRKRDLLANGLSNIGFEVYRPQGAYYVLADHTSFGFDDDVSFVRHLITEVGVAAIPPASFYHRKEDGAKLVRFAFCKDEATIEAALERLSKLA